MRKVLSIITLISLFMIMGATTIKNEESISEKSDCHYGIGNHDCSCRISEFYRAKYIL